MDDQPDRELPHYGLYIDGRWSDAADDALMPAHEPATGAPLAYVARGSAADGRECSREQDSDRRTRG